MSEKKEIPLKLRNFFEKIREWHRLGILPDPVIRKMEEISFPKKILQISHLISASNLIIQRSMYLFEKFYNLNVLYNSGNLEDLYLNSELLILACITVACAENGSAESKTFEELSGYFNDVSINQVAPYISIIRESIQKGF
jgi:hypothetical protein